MNRRQTQIAIVALYLAGVFSFGNLDVRHPLLSPLLFIIGVQCVGWAGILVAGLTKATKPEEEK